MKWKCRAAAAAVTLASAAPAVAHAAPPVHQPPANATFVQHLAEGEVPCGPITITYTDNERYTTFSTGVVLITGRLRAVVKSDITGRSVDLNVSGPGKIYPDDSAAGGGAWLLWDTEVLAYTTGRIVIPESGANTAMVKGRRIDLCPLLGF